MFNSSLIQPLLRRYGYVNSEHLHITIVSTACAELEVIENCKAPYNYVISHCDVKRVKGTWPMMPGAFVRETLGSVCSVVRTQC